MFLSPPALFPHLLPQWDSFYPNPDQSDLLGNQIPEREETDVFCLEKGEFQGAGGTGAFFKSQRPVKHLEKQKQYSC